MGLRNRGVHESLGEGVVRRTTNSSSLRPAIQTIYLSKHQFGWKHALGLCIVSKADTWGFTKGTPKITPPNSRIPF